MTDLPAADPYNFESTDPDELRAIAYKRWHVLREAIGRAQAARLGKPSLPALSVGRFEGVEYRNRGGFGVVFEVRDPVLDRHVALKCGIMPDDETRQRLIREAQIMAMFSHPNIVTVYETGRYGDDLFYVMELIEGRTAYDFIVEKPRPSWTEVVALYLEAGAGLAVIHRKGVVHGDFKPSNILLDADNWPRIK